jgi:outer membrane murein-binding lipoprotein Lpp
MKNKYFIMAAVLLIAGLLLTGCENNRDDAKDNVKQANQDMKDAQAQFDKEWQQFKSDVELKINANQKKIDDFNAAMKTTSKKFKDKYENKVLTLEQKNIELKKKLNDYKYDGKDSWEKFKQEFNNDMDSVGNALKGLFEKKD